MAARFRIESGLLLAFPSHGIIRARLTNSQSGRFKEFLSRDGLIAYSALSLPEDPVIYCTKDGKECGIINAGGIIRSRIPGESVRGKLRYGGEETNEPHFEITLLGSKRSPDQTRLALSEYVSEEMENWLSEEYFPEDFYF